MVGLAIKFELGRYHANPWGSHVNDAASEWPPSPWRLVRALYSTARTNVRLEERRPALDRALQALVNGPPPVFALPPAVAGHTRHYMPESSYSAIRSGDTAKVLDGFLAIDREAELEAWWDVGLDAEASDALAQTARALGYLGRSESVCSARMITGAGPERISAGPAESIATDDGEWELIDLLCPQAGQPLDTIAVSIGELRKGRQLIPPGTERVTYAVPRAEPPPRQARRRRRETTAGPCFALFRLQGSSRPGIAEAVAVGQALRSALQSVYGGRNEHAVSPTFSGRQGDERRRDQHRHAHYLVVPGERSRRVDRLAVWAPESFPPAEVATLAGITYLSLHQVPERLPISLAALGSIDDMRLPELLGSARVWRSFTPFGLVRHPKTRRGELIDTPEEQVRCELAHRDFPAPESVTLERGPWHRFRSSKAGQTRLDRARLFGVRLQFAEPVTGPLALGALSHFGLGVMRPEKE